MKSLQIEIEELILNFRKQLGSILGAKFYGLYLYSSTARGEFEPEASDIDFIVILNNKLDETDIDEICTLHKHLSLDYKYGAKLDGMYLQKSYIGKSNEEVDPYPVIYHAEYQGYGKFDINNITWWSLKTDGVAVDSPSITDRLKSAS
ncbi:nucleotidyltransferase domain-containing protein [Fusibacter sp. JL216-2]|uniref:nucleotidyltransferase domain-containing protein n=1 Tax=Fusibacter sp. JL216-2 TaxID=3071453 RepID=UPI003D340635